MAVKQGRFYLRHNTLSEDIPIVIIFKVSLQVSFENYKELFYTFIYRLEKLSLQISSENYKFFMVYFHI
jgi:hypothetical protein